MSVMRHITFAVRRCVGYHDKVNLVDYLDQSDSVNPLEYFIQRDMLYDYAKVV